MTFTAPCGCRRCAPYDGGQAEEAGPCFCTHSGPCFARVPTITSGFIMDLLDNMPITAEQHFQNVKKMLALLPYSQEDRPGGNAVHGPWSRTAKLVTKMRKNARPVTVEDARAVLGNALNKFLYDQAAEGRVPPITSVEFRLARRDEPAGQAIITINGNWRCGADPGTWMVPWYERKGYSGKWISGPHFRGEE